jgi:hypothetical protein
MGWHEKEWRVRSPCRSKICLWQVVKDVRRKGPRKSHARMKNTNNAIILTKPLDSPLLIA